MPQSRVFSIGDLHGCSIALAALIDAIELQPQDTLVVLGDFVDRGIDSKGVLDQLIDLQSKCNLVPILGNHDEMMMHARDVRFNLLVDPYESSADCPPQLSQN